MREFHRRAGRADAELAVGVTADDQSFEGVTKNIGVGGLFVATQHLRAVGDRLGLSLALPGVVQPISVTGEVRWTREAPPPDRGGRTAGMGVRFVDLPVGAFVAIHEFVSARELARRDGAGE